MIYSKIIGENNTEETKRLVQKSQEYLSDIFAELSTAWTNQAFGSRLGGDPFLMQLVMPLPHYCDLTGYLYAPIDRSFQRVSRKMDVAIPLNKEDNEIITKKREFKSKYPQIMNTAGTNGKIFYWAPDFLLSKSKVGVRLLINHEGMHAGLLHPKRRMHRSPALWNICIDYKANFNLFEDLRARGIHRPEEKFKELGDYITLNEYSQFVRDPYNPPPKMEELSPTGSLKRMLDPDYVDKEVKNPFLLYADPNLSGDMLQPESIYAYLMSQAPICKKCGKQFCYKKSEEYKDLESKLTKIREQNVKTFGTN